MSQSTVPPTSQTAPLVPKAAEVQAVFRAYASRSPTSLAIRETMRLVVLGRLLGEGRSLWDVGCGDGFFWEVFPWRGAWEIDGLEISTHEAADAAKRSVFRTLQLGDVTRVKPPRADYDVVLGNCSLEHIPDIHEALRKMRGALKKHGRLLLFVPAFRWSRTLKLFRALESISPRVMMAAQGALDGFFQHHHLYTRTTWSMLVEHAGFREIEAQPLGGAAINRVFERYLLPSLPEFAFKTVLGRYPPGALRLRELPPEVVADLLAQPNAAAGDECVEYLITATR
ncbi:MAG: class I SAM-dependent methyltransferase [Myxococcales bacterium]|nr:class I SAM-dependent methyltransferase [Myxococcales bacterium]